MHITFIWSTILLVHKNGSKKQKIDRIPFQVIRAVEGS